jgi:hypothetical protein
MANARGFSCFARGWQAAIRDYPDLPAGSSVGSHGVISAMPDGLSSRQGGWWLDGYFAFLERPEDGQKRKGGGSQSA